MSINLEQLVSDLHNLIEATGSPVKRGTRWVSESWEILARTSQLDYLKVLGHGSYAVVLETECGKALKIGFCPEDGGLMYAAFCRASMCAHVPKVYGIASTEYCYAVLMEKLEPWDGESCMGQWEQHRRGMTGHTENASALGIQLHRFFDGVGMLDSNPENFMVRSCTSAGIKTPELVLVDGVGQIGCSRLTGDEA